MKPTSKMGSKPPHVKMGRMVTRAELKSYLDDLKNRFLSEPNTTDVEKTISGRIDDVIRDCWGDRGSPASFALMAIGGYGRGTLHPESDIDLLFFFKDEIDESAIKIVLNPLWGLQFKVGHQIRNSEDFRQFDETHMESYTAFLDCRFLVGNPALAVEFEHQILQDMIRKNRQPFLKALADMKSVRYSRFGDTIFQLEPDLKEAPGGLRDIHWSGWVRKSIEPATSHTTRSDMLEFHHQIRNFLHFNSGRNFNVLSFEFQEQIAEKLAYKDSEHGEAAENLMRDYFLRAGEIAREARFWEEAIVGRPNTITVNSDFSDPFDMVEAFAEAHRKKAQLDSGTIESIRQRISTSNGALTNHPRAGRIVLDMMKDRVGIYDALLSMHEVGLLGRIFPDFEEIR